MFSVSPQIYKITSSFLGTDKLRCLPSGTIKKACVYLGQVSAIVDCCSLQDRGPPCVVHVVQETGEDFAPAMQQHQLVPHHHSGEKEHKQKRENIVPPALQCGGNERQRFCFGAQTGFLGANYRAQEEATSNAWCLRWERVLGLFQ